MYTGKEFKELCYTNQWSLIKYISSNDFSRPLPAHYNYQYTFGLNEIPPEEVSLDVLNPCSAGGLYFTYLESYKWIGLHWFFVTVPDDAQVIIEPHSKFKTDKLIIVKEIKQISSVCLEAVRRDGFLLKFIRNQTEEMCHRAVENGGCYIKYVKNQTRDLCLLAIEISPSALMFIKNQTLEICLAAVDRNPVVIQYVRSPTVLQYFKK